MATITSQAPSANFDQMTTTATIPVVTAPSVLTAPRYCQPESRYAAST